MTSCSAWSSLSVCHWHNCILIAVFGKDHDDGSTENMQTSHAHKGENTSGGLKGNSLSLSKTHNELIFPSVSFRSVRGDIDIHTSQQALCQFPSLIQICSEWSTNPSAGLAARMIARPVWRENYKSNTPGDLFSFCVISMHKKTSWRYVIHMKYFPPSTFLYSSMYRLSRFMQPKTWHMVSIHTFPIYFREDPITILDPCDLNLYPYHYI